LSLTGARPYLLQTEGQRDSVGNPGALRVVDMEGLAAGGSSRAWCQRVAEQRATPSRSSRCSLRPVSASVRRLLAGVRSDMPGTIG